MLTLIAPMKARDSVRLRERVRRWKVMRMSASDLTSDRRRGRCRG